MKYGLFVREFFLFPAYATRQPTIISRKNLTVMSYCKTYILFWASVCFGQVFMLTYRLKMRKKM